MYRLNHTRAILAASLLIAFIFVAGCDERNAADLPPVVYTQRSTITLPGNALHVAAGQNLLAIAASSAGTYVYDISDPAAPIEVFHYAQIPPFYSTLVALDTINGLVATTSEPALAPGDKFPIHYYGTGRRIGFGSFSGPFVDFIFTGGVDTFSLWGTDANDGLAESPWCHDGDSTWTPNCPSFGTGWTHAGVAQRGFSYRNHVFAIALNSYRIHLQDIEADHPLSDVNTPGDPHDCAWYGDYIIVADNLFLTVINAANLSAPEVVSSFTIPGADRLVRVEMDGSRAIVLDDADGVYVVDLADLQNPKVLQTISLPEPTAIAVANGKLIAADEQLGVLIYER